MRFFAFFVFLLLPLAGEAAGYPAVEYDKNGLELHLKDDATIRLKGHAQFDNRSFLSDDAYLNSDKSTLRRFQPTLEGDIGKFYFRLTPEFVPSRTQWTEAQVDYKPRKDFNLRVGKFKSPLGLEALQSNNDTVFMEKSFTGSLVPSRDMGVMAYGVLSPELEYQLGIFNGAFDGGNVNSDDDNRKDVAGRIFAQPFAEKDSTLKGLGVGLAGSIGSRNESAAATQLGSYKSPGQARIFGYASGTEADGTSWRLNPEAYYYQGPFGFLGEYVASSQSVRKGTATGQFQHSAWDTQFSYLLTGETQSYKGWPDPKHSWGAIGVAAKYAELNIDKDVFQTFANTATSIKSAQNLGFTVNDYLNDHLRLSVDYEQTNFHAGAANNADRDTEQALFTRVWVRF